MLQDPQLFCCPACNWEPRARGGEGESRSQAAPKRCLTYTPFPPLLPLDLNPAPSVLTRRSTHLRHPPPEAP